jgi:hypothetical protein
MNIVNIGAEVELNKIIKGDGINADLPANRWYVALDIDNPTVTDFYCKASFYKYLGDGQWEDEDGSDVDSILGKPINRCSYLLQN